MARDAHDDYEAVGEEAPDWDNWNWRNWSKDDDKRETRESIPVPEFNGQAWRDFQRRKEAWTLPTQLDQERRGPAV